jgi:hypothetical protein
LAWELWYIRCNLTNAGSDPAIRSLLIGRLVNY